MNTLTGLRTPACRSRSPVKLSCCAAVVVIAWDTGWPRWMRGRHKAAVRADVRPSSLPPAWITFR